MLQQQKLSYAEKTKVDPQTGETWGIREVKELASRWGSGRHHREIVSLHQAVEGFIDTEEYSYLLNPFGVRKSKELKVGARLRNYNILKGIANLLIGEYGRRIHEFTVTGFADKDESLYEQGLNQVLIQYMKQAAVNQLNGAGFPTGSATVEQQPIEQVVEDYKVTFEQNRIISGQEAIDFIRYDQKIDNKILDIYWDWIICGRAITYKTIRFDNVYYEHVPAEELYIPNETHSRSIEDFSYAVRRQVMSKNRVLDMFHDKLSEEDVEALDNRYKTSTDFVHTNTINTGKDGFTVLPSINRLNGCNTNDKIFDSPEGIVVFHCVWKSFRKVGTLYYIDQLGQPAQMEIDEAYTLDKAAGDIKIKWSWINETWQGWQIDGNIYVGIEPILENRADINNESEQYLPYNGIVSRSKTGEIESIIKEGIPYQLLINGVHFQVEKLINKNKDKLLVMPYGLIPRKQGMTTTDIMYHADSTSILWIDETAHNAQVAAQMIKAVDMSLGNYIKDLMEIMKYIKQEYWDAIGMNAQRYSNIEQGAGKGVTEQAIIRSSVITNEMNRQFDKLLEADYQGLLDISKLAWLKGKKGKYIRSDGSQAFLNLNIDDARKHSEASYGVFVKDSSELTENMQSIRNLALPFMQNQGNLEGAIELYSNRNIEKLKSIIGRIEATNRAFEAQQAQQERESAERIQQGILADKQADRDIKIYDIDKEYAQTVDSANIRAEMGSRANQPKPVNEVDVALAEHKINKENRELKQKDEDLRIKEKQSNKVKND